MSTRDELRDAVVDAAKTWHAAEVDLRNAQRFGCDEDEDRLELPLLDAVDQLHRVVRCLEAHERGSGT